ncbi:MAG: hypothetical protein QOE03_2082 [Micromonosporaceae bacterium]|nr:hypothetical protein [Micromonosporaceae bacterium]
MHITVGGIMLGAWAGFAAGWLFAVMSRAWRDVATARTASGKAQATAWSHSRDALVLGFLLVVVVAFALGHG